MFVASLWSEERVSKGGESAEGGQNKEWVGGAKEETKDGEWNEWDVDLLFNPEVNPFKSLSSLQAPFILWSLHQHPCLAWTM